MNIFDDKDSLIDSDGMDLRIESFQMAFALENASTLELKSDPKFVKWYAIHWQGEENEIKRRAIPMHKCN